MSPDLPPQLGGCEFNDAGLAVSDSVDGTSPGAWRLPLAPLSPTSFPEPFCGPESPQKDRAAAAARLVSNHAAVVRFAARGCGARGPRPVMAGPLSDPTAIPGEDFIDDVDAALRSIAASLLAGDDAGGVSGDEKAGGGAAARRAAPAAAAVAYMRDRIGVPRDLPLPAARQLRAHCNAVIDRLAAGSA